MMLNFKKPISCFTHIVKSDRVNALRKQYDAFLEEDKKRKERNEYILGKLDNMRYATAVQIRHKPIVYGDLLPVYKHGASLPEHLERRDIKIAHPLQKINHPNHQDFQLDTPRNFVDNTSILKEISKKYILIPKLRSSSLVNDYIGTIPPQSLPPIVVSTPQTNITNNEDWKSKYDILEQLKKKEKEETSYGKEELYPVKESKAFNKDDAIKVTADYDLKKEIAGFDSQQSKDNYDLQNYTTKESTTKYENEVPEKDLYFDQINVESESQNIGKPKINDSEDQEPKIEDNTNKNSAASFINPDVNTVYDYSLQRQGLDENTPIDDTVLHTTNTQENVQYVNNDFEENIAPDYNTEEPKVYHDGDHQLYENTQQEGYPIEYEQPVETEEKYPDSENVYLDKDDPTGIHVVNPTELVEEISNEEPAGITSIESKEGEVQEYPVEMLNVQEFTPNENVVLVDGVNVNPNYLASEQNVDPLLGNVESEPGAQYTDVVQDSSGVEAFDAEQKEVFYSEDTAEFAYDQQQGEDAYNQEYAPPQPVGEQDYPYYESPAALQEQEYPVEVNEHEETTMRYDQNYEQQYATNYENQEYQGQEQQQYDQTEGYDQTQQQYQNYEFQEPDQQTVQSVEQGLDNEQGYVYDQNLEENQVENVVTPLAQPVVEK